MGALNGWDIENLFWVDRDPDNHTYFRTPSGCGTGDCKRTVTYAGNCYQAGDVNYVLWGFAGRECKDFYDTAVSWRNGRFTFPDGTKSSTSIFDGRPKVNPFNLDQLESLVKLYRRGLAIFSLGLVGGRTSERVAWTRYGYYYLDGGPGPLPPAPLNATCAPCKDEFKGNLEFDVGKRGDEDFVIVVSGYKPSEAAMIKAGARPAP